MAEERTRVTGRRIAILLGTGSSCSRVLDALLPLLERETGADLLGVFVEEAELQAAAELPFVKELCRLTSSVREFQASDARRELARRMRDAHSRFEIAASRTGASHSFRSARGPVLNLLRETVTSSDITFFEPLRVSALTLLQAEERRQPARRRVAVVIGDARSAPAALRTAFELAQRRPERMAVLLTAAAAKDAQRIELALTDTLPPGRRLVDQLPDDTIGSVIAATRRLGAGCLVLTASAALLEGNALQALRVELSCPVVVVRQSAA
jgi:hypothetical protein